MSNDLQIILLLLSFVWRLLYCLANWACHNYQMRVSKETEIDLVSKGTETDLVVGVLELGYDGNALTVGVSFVLISFSNVEL